MFTFHRGEHRDPEGLTCLASRSDVSGEAGATPRVAPRFSLFRLMGFTVLLTQLLRLWAHSHLKAQPRLPFPFTSLGTSVQFSALQCIVHRMAAPLR